MKEQDIIDGKNRYKYNDFNVPDFRGWSLIIAGQSGSGKSYILNSILASLSDKVGKMYGFSSTSLSDDKFPFDKYTFDWMISDKLDMRKMRNIHQFNEGKTGKIKTLKRLEHIKCFSQLTYRMMKQHGNKSKAFSDINKLLKKAIKVNLELSKHTKKITIDEKHTLTHKLSHIHQKIVIIGCKYLIDHNIRLEPTLERAYDLLTYNSHILIVINDLSNDLKALKGEDLKFMCDLYDKARHADITIITLVHDWNKVPKDLRFAAHNIIFCTIEMVNNFLGIQRFTKDTTQPFRKAASAIIEKDRSLPEGERKYNALFWMRLPNRFEYIRANPYQKQLPVGLKKLEMMYKKNNNIK